MRAPLAPALLLALAATLGLAVSPAPPSSSNGLSTLLPTHAWARIGGTPPAFTLPAATGGPSTGSFRMGEHLGHDPVVILFWATWCVPCRTEMPFYQTLYERHQAAGLHIVAISMDGASSVSRVGPAARRLGVTFDVVTDLDTRITSQLNPRRAAPFSIWVNRARRITWEREGFAPSEQSTIEAGIAELVGGS
jgi:thiol-disulfide isomerase/thioredoxin